jgi:hypothetical protein
MFDFLKRPKVIAKVPTANVEPERYKGRPLLVILEQYILHCIGEGKAKDDPNMVHIVQRVWGATTTGHKPLERLCISRQGWTMPSVFCG